MFGIVCSVFAAVYFSYVKFVCASKFLWWYLSVKYSYFIGMYMYTYTRGTEARVIWDITAKHKQTHSLQNDTLDNITTDFVHIYTHYKKTPMALSMA